MPSSNATRCASHLLLKRAPPFGGTGVIGRAQALVGFVSFRRAPSIDHRTRTHSSQASFTAFGVVSKRILRVVGMHLLVVSVVQLSLSAPTPSPALFNSANAYTAVSVARSSIWSRDRIL